MTSPSVPPELEALIKRALNDAVFGNIFVRTTSERDLLDAIAALALDAARWRYVRTSRMLTIEYARVDPCDHTCLLASDVYDKRTPEWLEERIDSALRERG